MHYHKLGCWAAVVWGFTYPNRCTCLGMMRKAAMTALSTHECSATSVNSSSIVWVMTDVAFGGIGARGRAGCGGMGAVHAALPDAEGWRSYVGREAS
jgi:hypothetical protein